MNHRKRGLDYWKLDFNLNVFLKIAKEKNWQLYEIEQKEFIIFYASVFNRNSILKSFPNITLVKTTGVIGMILRSMKRVDRILAMVLCLFLWYGLSMTIFDVEILGEGTNHRMRVHDELVQLNVITPFILSDKQALRDTLSENLRDEYSWVEVERFGSKLKVRFLAKEQQELTTLERNELYAKKDGVIAKFELAHGEKVVAINDYVKAGDLLVKNTLIDSMNKEEELYVKGKVYAYTWKDFELEMEPDGLPEAMQFYQMLFRARDIASEGLSEDEKIISENILQFEVNKDRIRMKCHYTLLEDISS